MTYAILGASGQLGLATLQAVLERGVEPKQVVALCRTPSRMDAWAERGVQVRQADYDETPSLKAAFSGIDRLLLTPSKALPPDRVRQYANAVEAAQEAGVGHLLHYGIVGTALESPSSIMPFLLYAESALRTSGLRWTILRNGLYADPIADWVPAIVEMGTIPYPTGDGRCAYVSRADIARAGAAALTTDGHEGRIYNLVGPRALTTAEVCQAVARVTGKPVEDRRATEEDYVRRCREDGEPEWLTAILASLYRAIGEGFFDIASSDIEDLTGRRAETFEEYLRRRMDSGELLS